MNDHFTVDYTRVHLDNGFTRVARVEDTRVAGSYPVDITHDDQKRWRLTFPGDAYPLGATLRNRAALLLFAADIADALMARQTGGNIRQEIARMAQLRDWVEAGNDLSNPLAREVFAHYDAQSAQTTRLIEAFSCRVGIALDLVKHSRAVIGVLEDEDELDGFEQIEAMETAIAGLNEAIAAFDAAHMGEVA